MVLSVDIYGLISNHESVHLPRIIKCTFNFAFLK